MIVAVLIAPAYATPTKGDCDGAHAPPAYYNENCDGDDICQLYAPVGQPVNTIDCLDLTGDGMGGAQVFAVQDYDGAGTRTYTIFGTVSGGQDFCCYVDDDADHDIEFLWLEGTDYDDELSFSYGTRNLTHVTRFAIGSGGDDTLLGSESTLATYVDLLAGRAGSDTIHGQSGHDAICGFDCYDGGNASDTDELHGDDGDDDLHGDAGDDVIFGNDDDDTIHGGDGLDDIDGGSGGDTIDAGVGDDVCDGGDGADWIDGNVGDDDISGGAGADVLYGGNGDDEVCSGSGTGDVLRGGPSSGGVVGSNDDQLWAASTAVSPTGFTVGSNTNCGDNGAGFGTWAGTTCPAFPCCTYDLSARPSGCP